MGNRISRKKKSQPASAASNQEAAVAVPASSFVDLPQDRLSARKDESLVTKTEGGLLLSAREAPPTVRDTNEDNPLEFFRHCYALEDDPFTLYTQALLLKNQRHFAAASELFRSLLSSASLILYTRYHLALCLIAQDPELLSCHEEATQCLEDVVAAMKSSPTNGDANYAFMYQDSLELLAHMMICGRRFDRALELLDALVQNFSLTSLELFSLTFLLQQLEINSIADSPSKSAAQRQQQTLVSFQRGFCRYARGDPPAAVSSELPQQLDLILEQDQQDSQDFDPLEGIELLLQAEAASLREGLALLATST